ncbi:MAG: 5-formyltetrahydrofolate cyclo-ligase [Cyanobacteria bacterium P01_H01_bin.15]
MPNNASKSELRKYFLAQRRALSSEDCQQRSKKICDNLRSQPLFQTARTILSYVSVRKEPDLAGLFNSDRQWGLPYCHGKNLSWHYWRPGDPLEISALKIPEPLITAPQINPNIVDLLLIPAIACDEQNYRLGYGGGFYDRLLADPAWQQIPTIGVVYKFAIINQLPHDPWDQQLTLVVHD